MTKTVPFPPARDDAESPWVLRAENIQLQFGGQSVLRGVDLAIRPGNVYLLRGSNGEGKTSLADILCGMLEPTAGRIWLRNGGKIKVSQYPLSLWRRLLQLTNAHPERFGRWGIARTWQSARLFEGLSLRDNVRIADQQVDGERLWPIFVQPQRVRIQDQQAQERAQALLNEFGLGDRANSMADAVSLGQAKRTGILRAKAAQPQVLFLDEPLASLDGQGVQDVLQLLHRLRSDHEVALVIVEHAFNVPYILDIASEVWTLKNGKLQTQTPEAVRAELIAERDDGVPAWLMTIAGPHATYERTELSDGAVLLVATPAGAAEVLFSLDDPVIFRGSRMVIGKDARAKHARLSFAVRRGQVVVLMAPNGWGKSTIVSAAAGLLPVAAGDIRLRGRSIVGQPVWQRADSGLAVLQSANRSFSDLSVREVLCVAGIDSPSPDLQHLLGSRVGNLSSGETQALNLDVTLRSGRFTVGLLDEPFQSLDHEAVQRVCRRLADLLPERALLITVPRSIGSAERAVANQETAT